MIIAVDFDGVLNSAPYPETGAPMAGAPDAMRQLKADGHHLIIWTCREGASQKVAKEWLHRWAIPYDAINANHPSNVALYNNDCRKIYADLYIDDRQVGGFAGWKETMMWVQCLVQANGIQTSEKDEL